MKKKLFWQLCENLQRQRRINQLEKFDASWNIYIFPSCIVKNIIEQLKVGGSSRDSDIVDLLSFYDVSSLIDFAKQKYDCYKLKKFENCSMNELNMQMFYGILWRLLLLAQKRREMCSFLLCKASF